MQLQLLVLAPLLFTLFVPLLYRRVKAIHVGWFVLLVPVLLFVSFLRLLPQVANGERVLQDLSWIPSLGVNFTTYLDGLSILFALIITGIGSLVVLYSIYYLNRSEQLGHFYIYLLLFMTAMLGVVLSDNMIVLYTFWELTSLSSFLLIGFWYQRDKSRFGAQKSLLLTVFGGLAMLAGIVLLYTITGTFSIREILGQKDMVAESALFLPSMLLILLGAFSKSAQFPFHIWLPDAMEAPTPVSAYLHSATMVKAGIYLIARFLPLYAVHDWWFPIVSGIGLLTLIWGSFLAVKQTDLKGILAYSTVSQLGLIIILLGFSTPLAVTAAVFHLFNHAAFKGSLFMMAGIVDHETGTRDIRRLGGLFSFMPITATVGFIATFAMAGIPPFNGFLSKEMFFAASVEYAGTLNWGFLLPALAVLGSIFTFVYSMMLFFKVFRGELQLEQLEQKPHDPPKGMLISPLILVVIILTIGLFPNLISAPILAPAVEAITLIPQEPVEIEHFHGFNWPLAMTLIVIAVGTLIYLSYRKWLHIYNHLPEFLTWNGWYDRSLRGLDRITTSLTRIQMTGSLRNYLAIIFIFIFVLSGGLLLTTDSFAFSTSDLAPVGWYEVLLALGVIAAAITVPFLTSRIAMVLTTGAIGYIVVLFFVDFRAPDLALTQLVVETISMVLFLLAFVHLPRVPKEKGSKSLKLRNLLISSSVGLLVMLIAISAHSTRLFTPISEYFIKHSYDLAGGHNIVNVILVDFRGFDTMLEILVLSIAGLGIYSMIKLRNRKEDDV